MSPPFWAPVGGGVKGGVKGGARGVSPLLTTPLHSRLPQQAAFPVEGGAHDVLEVVVGGLPA